MTKSKSRIIFLILCFALCGLWFSSNAWFRLKQTDYYKSKGRPTEAIQLYNKVLRKNYVKKSLNDKILTKIHFDLGHLYAEFKLRNLAIESYAQGSAGAFGIAIEDYYLKGELDKDKLFAVGLLEAGKWGQAIKGLERLKQFYPSFEDVERYINTAVDLRTANLSPEDKGFLFSVGDAYIRNGLFDEAREFFTKRILDYGIESLEVLSYIHKTYGSNLEIKQKIWGDEFYVTLEDFETIELRLSKWVSNTNSRVKSHYIAKKTAYKGNCSEFLDISYKEKGYDFWVKAVKIPLDEVNFDLGIRVFLKDNLVSHYILRANVVYPKQEKSGICGGGVSYSKNNGWEEVRLGNLSENAQGIAERPERQWETKGMFIDKIIINPSGVSSKLYIDSIELYLTN